MIRSPTGFFHPSLSRPKAAVAAQRLRVVAAWNDGVPTRQIAVDEGISRTNVLTIIKRARTAGYTARRPEPCQSADDARPDA